MRPPRVKHHCQRLWLTIPFVVLTLAIGLVAQVMK